MIGLIHPDQTILETTIGYEQVAVDLTANLPGMNKMTTSCHTLDYALLEDFDHLYRCSTLL